MDAIAGVTFGEPRALVALAALPLAAWFFFAREKARRRRADSFASERIRGLRFPARALRPALVTAGLALAALALAAPQAGFEVRPVLRDEGSLLIALDVSASMAAEDLGVSRLTAAKSVVRSVLAKQQGRVAVLAFESVAELLSPLTNDTVAVQDLVDSLTAGELALAGTDLGAAILRGVDYLGTRATGPRAMLILSDGEDHGDLLDKALEEAVRKEIPISTVLLGTAGGGKIPVGNEFLRDESGNVVTTRAHGDALEKIARATGGRYIASPFARSSVMAMESLTPAEIVTAEGRTRRVPVERFQWPLALGVALLLGASFVNRGAE
ncbi:MAG TPA: VWA domain-containing protein [Thermoanaerobaculia bacterium]|nr:VWA domain-containing protein [Thermoanaerobaculia bacterium]